MQGCVLACKEHLLAFTQQSVTPLVCLSPALPDWLTAWGVVTNRSEEVWDSDGFEKQAAAGCERLCTRGAKLCCDSIPLPNADLFNAASIPQSTFSEEAFAFYNNGVYWQKRLQATFYTKMSFRRFPFDLQILQIQMGYTPGAPAHVFKASTTATALKLTPGSEDSSSSSSDAPGWRVTAMDIAIDVLNYSSILPAMSTSHPDEPFPVNPDPVPGWANGSWPRGFSAVPTRFFINIHVQREHSSHVTTLILPMMLSVFLTWAVFLVEPADLDTRVTTVVGMFTALTAMQFFLNAQLPSSSYTTALHKFILLCYTSMVFTVAETLLVHYTNRQDVQRFEKKMSELKLAASAKRTEYMASLLDMALEAMAAGRMRRSSRSSSSSNNNNSSSRQGGDREEGLEEDEVEEEEEEEEEEDGDLLALSLSAPLPGVSEGGEGAEEEDEAVQLRQRLVHREDNTSPVHGCFPRGKGRSGKRRRGRAAENAGLLVADVEEAAELSPSTSSLASLLRFDSVEEESVQSSYWQAMGEKKCYKLHPEFYPLARRPRQYDTWPLLHSLQAMWAHLFTSMAHRTKARGQFQLARLPGHMAQPSPSSSAAASSLSSSSSVRNGLVLVEVQEVAAREEGDEEEGGRKKERKKSWVETWEWEQRAKAWGRVQSRQGRQVRREQEQARQRRVQEDKRKMEEWKRGKKREKQEYQVRVRDAGRRRRRKWMKMVSLGLLDLEGGGGRASGSGNETGIAGGEPGSGGNAHLSTLSTHASDSPASPYTTRTSIREKVTLEPQPELLTSKSFRKVEFKARRWHEKRARRLNKQMKALEVEVQRMKDPSKAYRIALILDRISLVFFPVAYITLSMCLLLIS